MAEPVRTALTMMTDTDNLSRLAGMRWRMADRQNGGDVTATASISDGPPDWPNLVAVAGAN